jgi:hypothetical protein
MHYRVELVRRQSEADRIVIFGTNLKGQINARFTPPDCLRVFWRTSQDKALLVKRHRTGIAKLIRPDRILACPRTR